MARLLLLAAPALIAALALKTGTVPLKTGVALTNALILLFALRGILGRYLPALAVVAALSVSAVGDYFLSTKGTSVTRFVIGIGAFLLAHLGYLVFALLEGRLTPLALGVLLAVYLPYFLFGLRRAIRDPALSAAALVYLLASCVTFAAAFGIRLDPAPKAFFVAGVALIVVSDTIISFKEFLGWKRVEWLILPTYYLAHISIVLSLLLWGLGG